MLPTGNRLAASLIRANAAFFSASLTQVTGYLRFKSSDELKKREEKMADMELMMAGAGKRPDGTIGVKIGPGPVDKLRYVPSKTSPLGREKGGKTGATASLKAGGLGARGAEPGVPPAPVLPVMPPDATAPAEPPPPVPGGTAAPVPPSGGSEPPEEREREREKPTERMEPVHPEPPEAPPEPPPQPPPEDQPAPQPPTE